MIVSNDNSGMIYTNQINRYDTTIISIPELADFMKYIHIHVKRKQGIIVEKKKKKKKYTS